MTRHGIRNASRCFSPEVGCSYRDSSVLVERSACWQKLGVGASISPMGLVTEAFVEVLRVQHGYLFSLSLPCCYVPLWCLKTPFAFCCTSLGVQWKMSPLFFFQFF